MTDERTVVLGIVNAATEFYRGVIPDDRWHEPYIPLDELQSDIAAGAAFWGYEAEGMLAGVMGFQPVRDVDLFVRLMFCRAASAEGLLTRPHQAAIFGWNDATFEGQSRAAVEWS